MSFSSSLGLADSLASWVSANGTARPEYHTLKVISGNV